MLELVDKYFCPILAKKFLIFEDPIDKIFVIQTTNLQTLFTTNTLETALECCKRFNDPRKDYVWKHVIEA